MTSRRNKLDADMAEEMRAHLDAQTQRNLAAGMSPDEARAAAHRQFGGVAQIQERARDVLFPRWLDDLGRDLRFAGRSLRKSPGFTLVAVLSLALGIGANTALFSLLDEVLLRSLPVPRPDELVLFRWLAGGDRGLFDELMGITTTDNTTGLHTSTSLSYAIFERLRDETDSFSDVFAFGDCGTINVSIDNQAQLARGQCVTGNYFRGLEVSALRGRTLTPDDDRGDAAPATVISFGFWQRRFGGSEDAVGRSVRINGVPATIVGVTPPAFDGTLQIGQIPDLTLPLALDPQLRGGFDFFRQPLTWRLNLMARLRPGVSAESAHASTEAIFVQAACDAWTAGAPGLPGQSLAGRDIPRLRLEPGDQGLMDTRREYARPLRILVIIVTLVLAIACANVANLLLARAAVRRREIAVRLSVGASRWQLVRQLLTESLLLSWLGGALGILFAFWGHDALVQLRSYGSSDAFGLNLRVLGFTLGVSLVAGLLFGLLPAWGATQVDLTAALKENSRGSLSPSRFTLRRALMVAQVALSTLLLVGAGLFLRTLQNLRGVDTGFEREHLISFGVSPWLNDYSQPQVTSFLNRLLDRVDHLPGVRSAALSAFPLLGNLQRGAAINLESGRSATEQLSTAFGVNVVSPGYFATLQIPLMLGRDLSDRDTAGSPRVAVINETLARMFFPNEHPLGRRFTFGPNRIHLTEIVGVVRDTRYANLRDPISPTVYLPFAQDEGSGGVFIVRTTGDPGSFAEAIRSAVHATDPNVPIQNLHTQDEQVDQLLAQERLFALLSAFLGTVALTLACIGLYGLLAHQITTRTREIGVRMALGALPKDIRWLIVREVFAMVLLGIVIGVLIALGGTRFVSSMLFGLTASDPSTYTAVALLLMLVSFIACLAPARRAVRLDPMIALRAE